MPSGQRRPLEGLSAEDALAYVADLLLALDSGGVVLDAVAAPDVEIDEEQLIGRRLVELVHGDDRAAADLSVALEAALRHVPLRLQNADGAWVQLRCTPIPAPSLGEGALVVACLRAPHAHGGDRELEMLGAALDSSPVAVSVFDASWGLISYNPALRSLLGGDPVELLGSDPFALIHPDDKARLGRVWRATSGKQTWRLEVRLNTADGSTRLVRLAGGRFTLSSGEQVVVIHSDDLTEVRRQHEDLEVRATHDPLTGLANRRLFDEHLARVLRRASSDRSNVAVIFIDVDHFKSVNDAQGHAVGDAVLREVGRRLSEGVRPSDLVARLGGDEFAAVMEDNDGLAMSAIVRAERLRLLLSSPIETPHGSLSATVSVGIAVGSPELGADELLRRADEAMYLAKEGGRNRCIVWH